MYHILIIHLLVGEHLGCLQFLTVIYIAGAEVPDIAAKGNYGKSHFEAKDFPQRRGQRHVRITKGVLGRNWLCKWWWAFRVKMFKGSLQFIANVEEGEQKYSGIFISVLKDFY